MAETPGSHKLRSHRAGHAYCLHRLCMAPHELYQKSGRLRVRMEDGTKVVAGNAETTAVPQDHDAWVMGDELATEQGMTKRSQV